MFSQYTNKSVEEVLSMLKTSVSGLTKKEALLYQEKTGLNEIRIKRINTWEIFFRQIKSPFAYLLLIAAIISTLIGQAVGSLAVLIFICINVAVGFFQEYRAEKAVLMLQRYVAKKVKVRRDGKEEIIDQKFLVPGDIVLLEAGDLAPADLRVISCHNFLIDESSLTGESVPVSKNSEALAKEEGEIFKVRNIVFSGTSVISGKAELVVITTGKDTIFGNIVKSVSQIRRESTYEKNLLYFSKLILRIVVITIVLIFIANIALKGFGNFFELLLFSVALIVSILPEALPVVVTFALSKGSLKMAKEEVVVKRLSAIEDLGNIEVLCTDKTGTLTQNKLSLEKIVSTDKRKIFLYGALSSGAEKIEEKILNPFDAALFSRIPDDILKQSKKYKVTFELPFDSYRMRSAFLVEPKTGEKILIVKGAPESILKNCTRLGGSSTKAEILEDFEKEGKEGRRVLALAFKKVAREKQSIKVEDEKGLTFLGYFVFEDTLKTTAKEAIELSKKLGVQIKIITGDSKEVAGYVAQKTGLPYGPEDIISGQNLQKMTKEEFEDACDRCSVFARISPDVKHQIIKTLQKKYEVGFMGEGVNDAPALKTADVGIAVVEASGAAREASDVILLQKDLRVIVNGIKDGRTIFANINKYIKCALASNFGNFYSIAAISVFVNFLPMLPIQILLGNLLSDFPLILIATDSVDIEELRKPKLYQLHNILPLIISLALVSTLFDFIFFSIFYNQPASSIQTLWFVESILTEIALIFVIRTRKPFYKAIRPKFWLLSFAIADALFVIALPFLKFGRDWFGFIALPIIPLIIIFAITIAYLAVSEFVKLIYFKHWKPKTN